MSIKETPPPTGEAMKKYREEEKARLIKEKGHDCWDVQNVCTGMDDGHHYYYCGLCNDILQS
jgi:hypothetical protein